MSIRSIKKAEVIRSLLSDDTARAAQKVAYVASASLIVFGIFFSFTAQDIPIRSQTAQLSGSAVGAVNSTVENSQTLLPTFELTTTIPAEIVDDVQINFAAQHVSRVTAKITSYGDGTITDVFPSAISDTLYKFVIPGKTLAPGEHRLVIQLRSAQNTSVLERNFTFVKSRPLDATVSSLPGTDVDSTGDSTENIKDTEDRDTLSDNTNTSTPTEALSDADRIIQNAVVTETLNILLPQTNIKGITVIGFNAPEDTTSVVVSIRNKSSLTTSRLGTANRSRLATNWQYLYDSRIRPDGDYELFAEARLGSGKVLKDSVNITVSNVIKADVFNITPINTLEERVQVDESKDIQAERAALPVPRLPREFVPVTSEIDSPDVESTIEQTADSRAQAVGNLTRDILTTNRSALEDLYQRYSVALQSGNEMLIKAIESDISDINARFTTDLLKDPNSNYYASDVDIALKERFETMKKRIIAFEEIRKTSSNQKSSVDSDGDGISDFDEENLYFTDPNNPDTDNDGILDGIEIIRGFDPLNPSAEAIIAYESPKESFGLVRDDVLKVDTVVPVIATSDDGEQLPVQAEIRGVGLPNSFVTLFIFSTPVIVTVKTDDTGAFVYTFDKELEDGEHEVYVAVTDNAGAIIAQSNPFRFIKQAEAFTPQNSDDPLLAQTVTVEPIMSNQYNITVGFGILALGLILLMLGVGLRSKDEPLLDNAPA